jgi:hypothetical protein
MEFHEIKQALELPAVRLLRSPNAGMVLGFLHRAFKRSPRTAIPEGEFRSLLEVYLAELREVEPDAFPDTPANYLSNWRDEQHGFLRRSYVDGQQEAVFELTSGTEKSFLWLESLRAVEFVGTESRLASIFNGLEEILRYASDDADERIRLLSADAKRIQAEIDRIRATGTAEKYSPVKLNERYARLVTTARELLSDFRAVEENFQRIAREIAERHVQPGVTKGAIVGHMLDSHDTLKLSAQGQSFYAFRELLLSPDRQNRFDEAIEKAQQIAVISAELKASPLLSQLIGRLLDEDETVLASTQRVSANLRRVLDTTNLSEQRQVAETIRDIKAAALQIRETPPDEENFFELLELPDAYSAMGRTFWQEPNRVAAVGPVEVADGELGWDELRRFRNLPQIRLGDLRKNVDSCLEKDQTVILATVLDAFPPKHGVMEVLGYLIIASQEDRHYIANDDTVEIQIPSPTNKRWRVPAVLFGRGVTK